jgi:hypothetical protein
VVIRVQNGTPGIIQGGLNIIPGQFRVAVQQGIPGFVLGQLFQDSCYRNPSSLNDRLATTDTQIDFDAFVHG